MAPGVTQRRSQRVFLQMPVVVDWQHPNNSKLSERANTIVVNAHGGLVEMMKSPAQGGTVKLQNVRTQERIEAVVKHVATGDAGKFRVALEFADAHPDFWRISFPPADWESPRQEVVKKS